MIADASITSTSDPMVELRHYPWWQHPHRNSRIYFHPAPLRSLQTYALQFSKTEPPSEIGGILLGKIVPGTPEPSMLVMDVEFVSSDEPLYNTAPKDTRSVVAALSRLAGRGLCPVGYVRSTIREGPLRLTEQDTELIAEHLRDPNSLFLVIRAVEMNSYQAAFFFWQNGKLQTDSSDLEVTLVPPEDRCEERGLKPERRANSLELRRQRFDGIQNTIRRQNSLGYVRGQQRRSLVRRTMPVSPMSPEERKDVTVPSAVVEADPNGRQNRNALTAQFFEHRLSLPIEIGRFLTFCAIFGTAMFVAMPGRRPLVETAQGTSLRSEIGLQVSRSPEGLFNVSWNRNLPELSSASHANLTIIEGTKQRNLDIDLPQLRFGKLAYFPSRDDDVQFRLEIFLDGKPSIAESMLIVSGPGVLTRAEGPPIQPE